MDMGLEIGAPAGEAEIETFRAVAAQSLLFTPDADWPGREGLERLRVARIAGEVVGGYIAQPMGQYFGGRAQATAGIRAVAVAPEHRGAGIAHAMMRLALAEARAAGQPLSTLYPASDVVYRKGGFEQAGAWVEWTVPTEAFVGPARPAGVRRGGPGDLPLLERLYAERARRTNGHLDRNNWYWRRLLSPGADGKAKRVYVVDGDQGPEGYAILTEGDPVALDRGELHLHDLVVLTAGAAARMRTFLAWHSSRIVHVRFNGAPQEPLLAGLSRQYGRISDHWRWMLRLVDVPGALAGRAYAPGLAGEVALEVVDEVLPENAGRWVLAVQDGRGTVRPGGEGDVRLDVRGLAAVYTGAVSPAELLAFGQAEGAPAALARLGAFFAGPAPWMPDVF